MEHEIIRDHATKRSRGFGFIVFDSEKAVDNILANGNMIDMAGTQVSSVRRFRVNLYPFEHTFVIHTAVRLCCISISSRNGNYHDCYSFQFIIIISSITHLKKGKILSFIRLLVLILFQFPI